MCPASANGDCIVTAIAGKGGCLKRKLADSSEESDVGSATDNTSDEDKDSDAEEISGGATPPAKGICSGLVVAALSSHKAQFVDEVEAAFTAFEVLVHMQVCKCRACQR